MGFHAVSLNGLDSFQQEDGGAGFFGSLEIKGEAQGPVVEIVRVDKGLMNGFEVLRNVGVAGVAGFRIEPDGGVRFVVGVELA